MKRKVYLIPSLIAAGFMPSKTVAAPISGMAEKKSPASIFERLRIKHVYTLAGHSSHASHASHASSAGSGYLPRAIYDNTYTAPDPAPSYSPKPLYQAPAPLYSPPPAAIYVAPQPAAPPVPAPAPTAPSSLKVLPGNTDRFKRIVIQVQTGLIAFGYFPGPITGQVDAATKIGLSKMQDAYNLKVTGTITPEVLTALGISAN